LVGFRPAEWESVFTGYGRKKPDEVFGDYLAGMPEAVKAKAEADESPRKTRLVNTPGGKVAIMNYNVPILTDGQSALDFAVTSEQAYGCRNIAVNKEMIAEDFFDLSSGLAGDIVQKFVNYGFRLAVIGDFSGYTGKSLRDFIYESNKGRHLYFAADEDEALKKLGDPTMTL
jgi:hypothetical protein